MAEKLLELDHVTMRFGGVVALDDDIASRWGPRIVDLVKQMVAAVASLAK